MMFARTSIQKSSRSLSAISALGKVSVKSQIRSMSYMNDVLDENVHRRMFSSGKGSRDVDPLDETARSAFAKSCYQNIAWKVSETAPISDAVQRMVSHKIGALAVSKGPGEDGEVVGIISERDYLNKVSFLNKNTKDIKVGEICTYGKDNLVSVTLDNPIDKCMEKLIARDCRHLLVREKESGKMVGLISIKDVVKCALAKHNAVVNRMTEFVVMAETGRHI